MNTLRTLIGVVVLALAIGCGSTAPKFQPDGVDPIFHVSPIDSGASDAGGFNAGTGDAGMIDAGALDAGPTADAGGDDAGLTDGGIFDAGLIDAGPVDGPSGWTLLDPYPAPRHWASGVIDTIDDRVIVFGGVANDVWSFSLADGGWTALQPPGTWPSVIDLSPNDPYAQDNRPLVVFDPDADRILWVPRLGDTLRALSLSGTPTWSTVGPSQLDPDGGGFTQFVSVVFDRAHGRLLAGGRPDPVSLQLYSFDLDGGTFWKTEVAQVVPMLIDAPNDRALVRLEACEIGWLSLGSLIASKIQKPPYFNCFDQSFETLIYDPAREVVLEPSTSPTNPTFEGIVPLDGGDLTEWLPLLPEGALVLRDEKRSRTLVFGGRAPLSPYLESNAVQEVDDDGTITADLTAGPSEGPAFDSLTYDPTNQRLIAVQAQHVYQRALHTAWTELGPGPWPLGPLYQPVAALVPGGSRLLVYALSGDPTVTFNPVSVVATSDLSSQPLSWVVQTDGGLPSPHQNEALVTDLANQRVLMLGSPPQTLGNGDLWAYEPASSIWAQLSPNLGGISEFNGPTTAYDPVAQVVYTWPSSAGYLYWMTMVNLTWAPQGMSPTGFSITVDATVFDSVRGRLVAVTEFGTVVAYDTQQNVWHRYCGAGLAPLMKQITSPIAAVLADDQMVVSVNGGLFAFDLATPYCDGIPIQ